MKHVSRDRDLNPEPTVYDTVALPIELSRQVGLATYFLGDTAALYTVKVIII